MAKTAKATWNFDILESGICGRVEIVPEQKRKPNEIPLPLKTLPFGLPPVLPDWKKELESYLVCPEKLPIHDYRKVQKFWPREKHPENLFHVDVCPVQTTIRVERNLATGQLLGYKEEFLSETGSSVKNSLSFRRPPGPPSQDVKGNTGNYPFWPGGLDELEIGQIDRFQAAEEIDLEKGLLTCAPGLDSGMTFEADEIMPELKISNSIEQMPKIPMQFLKLTDLLMQEEEKFDFGIPTLPSVEQSNTDEEGSRLPITIQKSESLEKLVEVKDTGSLPVIKEPPQEQVEEWAILVDINNPVEDFHKRILDMAHQWPFELDTFQKQAILCLENHDSVFVAAHTSAGKTVIAEYAIALSFKHYTRTVYTSPIKALSNQKFRDFKKTFTDVGLITGDVQLNQTASCLIMTTEILRSMLYNGSDVVRDLEWVIFDEVHYVNDADRGVVWEEVLIMLPQHVNIILLSATVPNTMEFAAWVGKTKKKKIYVISTAKRPVPLEHCLYTGNSNKTSNELFLLLDSSGKFLTTGYNNAVDAKKERASKSSQSYGAKGTRMSVSSQQEKNIWLSLIDMLKKKDKLPVVAFTFSKKKINDNVDNLTSVDLTSTSEKNQIHIFFQKCIVRLKGLDRHLPQVRHMEEMSKRGLGIHHSGILPILKEVVEMLFQKGLLKILFATETFAMGVNMPARTVVFDSIRKHDGTNFRDLLPGEYIQMAGRAGRRGLDTTGTVIILCKADVPEISNLHRMMLGKPTKLESQFRLTYPMILNLLRVEQLRIEDMMKRSFSEFHSQQNVFKYKASMMMVTKKLEAIKNIECCMCAVDLEKYFDACNKYYSIKSRLQNQLLSHASASKIVCVGRVVVVSSAGGQKHTLGVILHANISSSKRLFTALVLSEKDQSASSIEEEEEEKNKMHPVLSLPLFLPEGPCGHQLVQIGPDQIEVITTKTLKVDVEKIVNDVKKRQQARFSNDPPGQSVSIATQELLRLTESNPEGLSELDMVKQLHINDIDTIDDFRTLHFLKRNFREFTCVSCPNFQEHFRQICYNRKLKKEYNHLSFLLSDDSLSLLPEYQQRVQALKKLNYLDVNNAVQLKGRVACEINNHELLITELVFNNILTTLHPTDIAAVLSCVVFKQKRYCEPQLTDILKKCKDDVLHIAEEIGILQQACNLPISVEDYQAEFKFGLMEVVFEWARGLPFSEIMELTDVQEGIIVRCIQRLHETLRDVKNAAKIIGDPVLYQKMEEATNIIKRDIVFTASLYTQ